MMSDPLPKLCLLTLLLFVYFRQNSNDVRPSTKVVSFNTCYCLCTSGKAVMMSDPLPKLCLLTLVTVCVLQAKQ